MNEWWGRWRIPIMSTLGLLVTLLVGFVTGRTSWGHIVHVGHKVGEPSADWLPVAVDGMMVVGAIMAWVDSMRGYKPRGWSIAALWFGSLGTVAFNVLSAWERGIGAMIVAAFPAIALLITVECVFHPSRRLLDAAITAIADAVDSVSAPMPETVQAVPDAGDSMTVPPGPVDAPETATAAAPAPDGPARKPRRRKPRTTGHPGTGASHETVEAMIVALTDTPHQDAVLVPAFVGPAVVDVEAMAE